MTHQVIPFFASKVRRFVSGVLLSRISGLGRDLVMAFAFGDHPSVAVFMIALRFSNLLRRFFGEGPLQSVFIPHFQGLYGKDPHQAYAFFRKVTFLGILIITGLIVLIEGGLALFSNLMPLSSEGGKMVQMGKTLIPCLLFASLYGLNLSVLECHNAFFLPNMAPSISNLIWIGGALYLKKQVPEMAMLSLANWVLAGFFFQWAFTVPFVWRIVRGKFRDWAQLRIDPEIKRLAYSFRWVALGVAILQINGCLDAIFARFSDLRGPVYLWYAARFYQLALAFLGIGTVRALLPSFSRKIKEGDLEEGKEIFSFGMRLIWTVMLICTFAFLGLSDCLIDLFYRRGQFSSYAVGQTATLLKAYALGLVPAALVMLQSNFFYAKEKPSIPTRVALLAVGMNITLNSLFVFLLKLSPMSVALASSLSSWTHFFILSRLLIRRDWKFEYPFKDLLSLVVGCSLALLLVYVTSLTLPCLGVLGDFLLRCLVFLFTLFLYAHLCKNRDLKEAFRAFLARG